MTSGRDAILLVESGLPQAGPIALTQARCVFGKSPSCDVEIDSPFVSRSHFQVRFDGGRYTIEDLGSKNGTYLNGEPLDAHRPAPLADGDRIALADDLVVFVFRDSTETITLRRKGPARAEVLRVDAASREVWVRGAPLSPSLSRKEFDVLALLYRRRGEAVSRDEIAAAGWPERPDGDVGNQEVEQCVRRIRRRLEGSGGSAGLITTVRGYGYRLG